MAKIKIVHDNTEEAIHNLDEAVEAAMEKIGMKMEGYAKLELTSQDAVDTGRLRNSISHVTHTKAESKSYRWGDSSKGRGTKGGSDSTDPRSIPKEHTVVVGTNVEYAPYIELGTSKQAARPFLKPSVVDHLDEYKKILKEELKNE